MVAEFAMGAAQAIAKYVESLGGPYPAEVEKAVEDASRAGRTPLVVCECSRVLGVAGHDGGCWPFAAGACEPSAHEVRRGVGG